MRLVCVAIAIAASVAAAAAAPDPSLLINDKDLVLRVTRGDGTVLLEKAYGNQSTTFNVAMTTDAHFMIGSNSKLFTTVSLYQLQEAGKVNLSHLVADYLDNSDFTAFGFPDQKTYCPKMANSSDCEPLTFHHLLSMSSGIYPQLNCNWPTDTSLCNRLEYIVNTGSVAATVGSFINAPLIFTPGSHYLYSNPNFVLATYFVQKFSGMSFNEYVQAHIAGPLGLRATYLDFYNGLLGVSDGKRTVETVKYYNPKTYKRIAASELRLDLDTGATAGTGGMISSQQDLERFWHIVFNQSSGGAPLFKNPASQQAFFTPFTRMPMQAGAKMVAYYTQGMVMACMSEGCPDGPAFMNYEGGTLGSHTANLLDMRAGHNYTMTQAWTSSVQFLAEPSELASARATAGLNGGLPPFDIFGIWNQLHPIPFAAGVNTLTWNLMQQFSGLDAAAELASSFEHLTTALARRLV